jgi:acyl-CoA reductase-like NAD-dependent aldehyde dehydrogenase
MSIIECDEMIARNPATGSELGRIACTPAEGVRECVGRARGVQSRWDALGWPARREAIRRWWAVLAGRTEEWVNALVAEIGKPRAEAMSEVVATLDALRWLVANGGRALRPERIGAGWQRFLLIPSARLEWRPLGVVGMIGTWNYPLYLNAAPMAHALAAGNALVWKPSELAPLVGQRLQQSFDAAGMPAGLVTAVYGGPDVGQALVTSPIDKAMFTGGIENGRRVLGALAKRGTPAIVELSGFDPAIVFPDAPRESTVRMLTWAAFVASGQACISVKRIYVVGDGLAWAEALAARAQRLRLGDPAQGAVDLGPLISGNARDRFHRTIEAATSAGARLLCGGAPAPGPGWFYPPTVLLADDSEPESVLAGCFGPAVVVRGVKDAEAAIEAANASSFGLAASLWGRNLPHLRSLASRIEAGMVGINEAVVPTAHAAAPFGGTKASGFGSIHGVLGLREFVRPLAIHTRAPGGPRPQLFPYSSRAERMMAVYRRVFHRA